MMDLPNSKFDTAEEKNNNFENKAVETPNWCKREKKNLKAELEPQWAVGQYQAV